MKPKLNAKENTVNALNLNSVAKMANVFLQGGVAIMKMVNIVFFFKEKCILMSK